MDLLSPCKMCLHCLPFFHASPPPSPRPSLSSSAAAAAEETLPETQLEEKSINAVEEEPPFAVTDPFTKGEKPSTSSDAAALPHQQQDLPLSEDCTELPFPVYHATIGPEGALEEEVVAAVASGIIIAPAVTAQEDGSSPPVDPEAITMASELPLQLPFVNDVDFSSAGLMILPSPVTPAPMGSGYLPAQHHPHHHIHHHDHAHHHDHGHDLSHSYDHVAPPNPPLDSSHDQIVPPYSPSESSQSHHDQSHTHHPTNHDNDHDAPTYPSLESSQSEHDYHGHTHHQHPHDHEHDTPAPDPPFQISQSAPDLELVNKPEGKNGGTDEVMTTSGSSSLLETSQSDPIVLIGASDHNYHGLEPPHVVRRRDQLKQQLRGLHHQLKQGGHLLKEEGSRQIQNVLNNVSKQAQQLEESGSFFIVPRGNNN